MLKKKVFLFKLNFKNVFSQEFFVLVFSGLHDAADDAEGQRSGKISGLLHSSPRHDVSPQSDLDPTLFTIIGPDFILL